MRKIILVIFLLLAGSPVAFAGLPEGLADFEKKHYMQAMAELKPIATAGDAQASHLVGLMHYAGLDGPRDYEAAMRWERQAAAGGIVSAKYMVGLMYFTGKGASRDQKQAAVWFRQAAESGNAEALQALAEMYHFGLGGLPKDDIVSFALLKLASGRGGPSASSRKFVQRLSQRDAIEAWQLIEKWEPGKPLPSHLDRQSTWQVDAGCGTLRVVLKAQNAVLNCTTQGRTP